MLISIVTIRIVSGVDRHYYSPTAILSGWYNDHLFLQMRTPRLQGVISLVQGHTVGTYQHQDWSSYLSDTQHSTFEGSSTFLKGSHQPLPYLLYLDPEGCCWLGLGVLLQTWTMVAEQSRK